MSIVPHFGQANIRPAKEGLLTFNRAAQEVHVMLNPDKMFSFAMCWIRHCYFRLYDSNRRKVPSYFILFNLECWRELIFFSFGGGAGGNRNEFLARVVRVVSNCPN